MLQFEQYNLAEMNDYWNHYIKGKADASNLDYWQTPSETVACKTGDCDDYAVIKYFTLLAYGAIPSECALYCVKLKDVLDDSPAPKLTEHVFTVYQDWVLDNVSTEIVKLTQRTDIAVLDGIISLTRNSEIAQFKSMMSRFDETKDYQAIRTQLAG